MILRLLLILVALTCYHLGQCENECKNWNLNASDSRFGNLSVVEQSYICNVVRGNLEHQEATVFNKNSLFDVQNFTNDKAWVTLILTSGLCLVSYGIMRFTPFAMKINVIPGDLIFPFIGSCYIWGVSLDKMSETLSQVFERHGRIFRMWVFHRPIVFAAEANSLQELMSGREHVQKPKLYEEYKWILGNGLVTSDAHVWRVDRKIMDLSFKYQRFDGFLATFNKHSKILVQILEERFKRKYEPQNLHPILCLCGMDFITEATLGKSSSYQYDSENDFVRNTGRILQSFKTRLFRPWMKLPIIRQISGWSKLENECAKFFKNHFTEMIDNRRRIKSNNEDLDESTKPFIDSLIDASKCDADIVGHVTTVFGGGFDTTASAMNYTMFLLALNPQYQSKVHKELDEIFESDHNRDVTFSDLAGMKYLEMCLKEGMRLFPPVPFTGRVSHYDIKLANGMVIPKGCDVLISIYDLHRDPKVFPEPETFNPERFQLEECQKMSNYAYMPFSAGPRNCIGQKYGMMEIKTVLAIILRKFKVTTNCTRENLKVTYGMILEPAGCGVKLLLTDRYEEM